MIDQPLLLFVALISIESAVLWLAGRATTKKLFHYVPAVFWIYFLPMLASSLGLIADKSPLYALAVDYVLPASLILLMLGVDLKAIARLGRSAILIFLSGSIGIMIGTAVTFAVFRHWVGDDFYAGFAALSASWMGGSANMVAVKEAVGTPDAVFLPMVVVDTVVPYVWMGFLIYLSTWQGAIDQWNKADQSLVDDIKVNMQALDRQTSGPMAWPAIIVMTMVAFAVGFLLQRICARLPVIAGVVSAFTWVIILVSALGLAGSLTPLRRLEQKGLSKAGYFLLYFVLTTIGAKANINNLGDSLILIAAGFMTVGIHGIIVLAAARFLKAPLMLAAAASQANLGGVASAPIVAEVYQPGLAPIGLLMAVLGNIIGTYLGIIVGQICRAITLM